MLSILGFSLSVLALIMFWVPFPIPVYWSTMVAGVALALALSPKNKDNDGKRMAIYTVIISSLTIIFTLIFYLMLIFNP